MLSSLLLAACLGLTVDSQHLRVSLAPATHELTLESTLTASGGGSLALQLSDRMKLSEVLVDGKRIEARTTPIGSGLVRLDIELGKDGTSSIVLRGRGVFDQDVAAGERPGQIHNFSVDATIGDGGVFLSDGSAWHPRPLDANGRVQYHAIDIEITPVDGWAFVASGDPTGDGDLNAPRWSWRTPRPVDGLAIAGNKHTLHGVLHETKEGPVEIVMHVPAEHAAIAEMYLAAAKKYLDLYVPLLGRFPYRRFSIVENFFSSGFAYPGFTVLGPQVVGMAPRSLVPGYLDHELLHNWWGNGVYVSQDDGNWCEALTSYGANYWRRIADDGPAAGRAYRRDTVMKLSTDPATLDDGPLGAFGSANPASPGPNRFVGYDKGAFVFFMLDGVLAEATHAPNDDRGAALWKVLRRFAESHLGKPATWADIQKACEAAAPDRPAGWLSGFFDHWVRGHAILKAEGEGDAAEAFAKRLPENTLQPVDARYTSGGALVEVDPDFRIYRVLPAQQLVPTMGGTTGPGGLRATTEESRKEVQGYLPQLEATDAGENLILIGTAAIEKNAALLARCSDPIVVQPGAFTVAGKSWSAATNAVLHTMHHPDRPGRYITVFHANGESGWSRLRLIRFYTRDTTIVWDGEQAVERRAFEPDRRVPVE